MIFNIQRCSLHDGEGLRTLVFFKGCPLRCPWCANPESQMFEPEVIENKNRCVGCGSCFKVCGQNAIKEDGTIDRQKCTQCFKCTEICYAEAKRVVGKKYTAEELYKEIQKDADYFQNNGGGVTFSGGEPLMHPVELTEIAKKCHENGVHTMLESCGFGNYDDFCSALPYIDKMFIDIKIMDPKIHKAVTGVSNEIILGNIKKIAEHNIPVTIRTPLIPGYTDSEQNLVDTTNFIRGLPNVGEYELLRYHNLGMAKYKALGRKYQLPDALPQTEQQMRDAVKRVNSILEGSGIICFWTNNNDREVVK